MISNAALTAAQDLAKSRFPDAQALFFAGSLVRGEGTTSSDLDIVVVTQQDPLAPYRDSLIYQSWPVELFVHTPDSLELFFAQDIARRRPSLPQMCAEGIILVEQGQVAQKIKTRARDLLAQGPEPLTEKQVRCLRYQLTDLIMDLEGPPADDEVFFVVAKFVPAAIEALLSFRGFWVGDGKWHWRVLAQKAPEQARILKQALKAIEHNELQPLLDWGDTILNELGGRLFEGFMLRA